MQGSARSSNSDTKSSWIDAVLDNNSRNTVCLETRPIVITYAAMSIVRIA